MPTTADPDAGRSDGLTTAAEQVTNQVASDVLDVLGTTSPGPDLGPAVADAASGGASSAGAAHASGAPETTPAGSLPSESDAGISHRP